MKVSEADKVFAKTLVEVLGGKPTIQRHYSAIQKTPLDILKCSDTPQRNLCTYSTLGLRNTPLVPDEMEFKTRVELLAVMESRIADFDLVLATAAYRVIEDRWFCGPGVIFPDLLKEFNLSNTMEHLYFTSPFLWPTLKTKKYEHFDLAWLLVIPISESERQYAKSKSPDALEATFEAKDIDIFDINRHPVI